MIKIECKALDETNINRFLNDWGLRYTSLTKESFQNQGWEPNSWAPKMVPNIAGILNFLDKGGRTSGGNLPNRFFERRPALRDTGLLESSIKHAEPQNKTVVVGTSLPYATIQHYGLTSTIQITGKMVENIKILLKKGKYKFLRPYVNKSSITVKPTPRKIFGWNDECQESAKELVIKHFLSSKNSKQ